MPGAYGIPSGANRFSRYQRGIIAHAPMLYFPLDEASGSATVWDFMRRYSMAVSAAPTGLGAMRRGGSRELVCIDSGAYSSGNVLAVPGTFTMGGTFEFFTGADSPIFSSWNGNGQMFWSDTVNIRFYVNANFASAAPATSTFLGLHQWIGTYDGTTATLYTDGVSRATATPGAPTSGQGWGLNNYSNAFKSGRYVAADCFVLPKSLSASEVAALYALWSADKA